MSLRIRSVTNFQLLLVSSVRIKSLGGFGWNTSGYFMKKRSGEPPRSARTPDHIDAVTDLIQKAPKPLSRKHETALQFPDFSFHPYTLLSKYLSNVMAGMSKIP